MTSNTHNTITIITSPAASTKSLPGFQTAGRPSPTTKQAPVYRIEERKRTVYVTSDVSPSEWDTHSLNTILNLTDVPENGQVEGDGSIRRTRSLVETQVIITEDGTSNNVVWTRESRELLSPATTPSSPRMGVQRPRRGPVKSAGLLGCTPNATPPDSPRRSPVQTPQQRPRILFYHKHDPYYGFTNFSAHSVMYKGKLYPTSEHLFQSFKFQNHRPNLAEHIRTCSERPSVAFSEARRFQPEVRPDWKQVNIEKMEEALWHKFTQHADLKAELLSTGDAELIEDSDKDAFWGVGADRRGRNELGKALERLRTKLRAMQ